MRYLLTLLLLGSCLAQTELTPSIPENDRVRIREFYRLADQLQDRLWSDWGKTPAPLLLVTEQTEFLTHLDRTPQGFEKSEGGFLVRNRQFPTGLLATFPAFGPPSVIVIGEAEKTEAKTSTPWVIVLMHEHFHQLQDGQPGAYEKVSALGLAKGDTSGMWMLNYAFPYDDAKVNAAFAKARDLLLTALEAKDEKRFRVAAKDYLKAREAFLGTVSEDDRKYWNFQTWKEGIARYTQVRVAEAAEQYDASAEFKALADYQSFAEYGKKARAETLAELRTAQLAKMHRVAVYSYGAAEGMLLDRLNPKWHGEYFQHLYSLEPLLRP